jgi:hypothetical protein
MIDDDDVHPPYSTLSSSSLPTLLSSQLKQHSVELLSDSVNEYFVGTKLHFKLRLEAKDYAGMMIMIMMIIVVIMMTMMIRMMMTMMIMVILS